MFLVKNENLGIAKANFLTLSETNKDHADQKQREDVATRDSLEAGRQVSQHEAMAAHNARGWTASGTPSSTPATSASTGRAGGHK